MTLNVQFMTMAAMILSGIGFGMMLDTYQRFLNRPKRKSWIAFINDILFWTVQALVIFYVLFLVNRGEIRFYIFLALLCGFAAYQALVKGFYLWFLNAMLHVIQQIWRFIVKLVSMLVFKPIIGLFQLALGLVFFLGKAVISSARFLLKALLKFIKIIFFLPVSKVFLLVWKLLPKGIKKTVEKIYNKVAGFFKKAKNVYKRAITWNKNKK
ncbi:spore cortex biosynthesis protein YabQ [Bacillus sp. FJAT-27225]|uniref:spore cortex biosynthesis protein YabQ n=1 Tax=Bacillus sp. FJAT-27225 TaxID=1743144 RepID=UPI00080C24BB|nr:spore cortex biosynthesis protein YabQ [Bacillus sp. FJAT-27225]OCA80684.1 spore cortex biosynthesis protein YabQ [Bacillus sp. FJAT-27225]